MDAEHPGGSVEAGVEGGEIRQGGSLLHLSSDVILRSVAKAADAARPRIIRLHDAARVLARGIHGVEGIAGAVLAKICILVFIIVFIQKRPQGIFAIKGRFADS
jgi:hypothetical protein